MKRPTRGIPELDGEYLLTLEDYCSYLESVLEKVISEANYIVSRDPTIDYRQYKWSEEEQKYKYSQ